MSRNNKGLKFDSSIWGKKVFETALKKFNNQLKTCKNEANINRL